MADTFTSSLGLVKPEIGSSRDTWGAKTNGNWDLVDQTIGLAAPIGMIADYAGPTPPPGWMVADGRLVSRVQYAALFAILGTYWGAGDGSTTFALPKLQGRALVGPGTVIDQNGTSLTLTFTQQLGWLSNTILQTHLPNYAMTVAAAGVHTHGAATGAAGSHGHTTDAQGIHQHGGATTTESVAHSHSGTTDVQGDHNHTVNAFGAAGGGYTITGGGFPTGNPIATSVNGAHQHNFTTSTESALHFHGISLDGSHAHNVTVIGDHTHPINADGSHTHTVNLGGGGTLFGLLSPTIVVTKIIFAGSQAVTHAVGAVAPTIEGRDELAVIREELAALKAILAPARSPRLLSAPARGMH